MVTVGKAALQQGTINFNKVASSEYKLLQATEKQQLVAKCSGSDHYQPMSIRDIKKSGARIFRSIKKKVCLYSVDGDEATK